MSLYVSQIEKSNFGNKKISFSVCPNGTYWHSFNFCKPCPDVNHITMTLPAVNSSFCVCKSGFIAQEDNRCEVIKCPKLEPPENGYFVKHPTTCGHVLNAACGARCKSGYQFSGSSIRLCQENGTWSGVEANCFRKFEVNSFSIQQDFLLFRFCFS